MYRIPIYPFAALTPRVHRDGNGFTALGLFSGQSKQFFEYLHDLAEDEDEVVRNMSLSQGALGIISRAPGSYTRQEKQERECHL
jgi:hypothetical protein